MASTMTKKEQIQLAKKEKKQKLQKAMECFKQVSPQELLVVPPATLSGQR